MTGGKKGGAVRLRVWTDNEVHLLLNIKLEYKEGGGGMRRLAPDCDFAPTCM